MPASAAFIALAIATAAMLSAALTWAAIRYAHRRAMYDEPGRRRSHRVATPRGGGIAIVVVVALAAVVAALRGEPGPWAAFALGLGAVALVGWIDDHRPMSALARLAVHFAAALLFVVWLPRDASQPAALASAIFALEVLLLATAINFFNFMDGINGLVTTQAAWVATCLTCVFAIAAQPGPALLAAILAAACLGFLPFNFPRARIFLGDVGSGGLGFACGALLLWGFETGAASPWLLVAVAMAIGVDAGLTLVSRMLRRRRWYTAHREHLYQWMVRSGRSHASTTVLYLAWNLILVLPVLWISTTKPAFAPFAVVLALGAGGAAWWSGKRRILAAVRSGQHA